MGKYDSHLMQDYTKAEFEELDQYIDHKRDLDFSYAAVKQLEGKYFVQNRVTKEIYESAQFLYILVAACLFAKYLNRLVLTTSNVFTTHRLRLRFLYLHRSCLVYVRLLVNSALVY